MLELNSRTRAAEVRITQAASPPVGGAAVTAAGLVRAMRPRQWLKNLLVFAAPAAAGRLAGADIFVPAVLAFVVFTLAAGAVYLVNDVADRRADARHPTKRFRPIASGVVSVRVAVTVALLLATSAVVLPLRVGTPGLAAVVGVYLVANAAYNLGAKDLPLVELGIVASGFVLRALAGALATGTYLSNWFLIVVSFASIYIVATKRHAERRDVGRGDGRTRETLRVYSTELLREIRFSAAAVTITAYVLWAFESGRILGEAVLVELSILPFVLAMYRYAMVVDRGAGESPEDILLGDTTFQTYAAAWVLTFGAAVYF